MSIQSVTERVISEHYNDLTAKCTLLAEAMCDGDNAKFKGACAALGGAMRRARSAARIMLTTKLLREFGITPTQHVARHVMTIVFNEAASTKDLMKNYAEPGRKADHKFVEAALTTMQDNRELCEAYSDSYKDFNTALEKNVAIIKAQEIAKATLDRPVLQRVNH